MVRILCLLVAFSQRRSLKTSLISFPFWCCCFVFVCLLGFLLVLFYLYVNVVS